MQAVSAPSLEMLERTFRAAKSSPQSSRSFARLNDARDRPPVENCLYVGSCRSIVQRVAEHLGYGHAKTYSLQLRHWADCLNLRIELVCAEYAECIEASVLQQLEDALWENRRLLFGRKGAT